MSGNVTSDPPAEPALTVDTREELVYLLGQACEIEHGLMCEYLYAQFSLKRGLDEGLTEGQLARVQAWEKALISVIKQEMLHLALATNILTAIGAAPHFERPNFPILSRWYPPGVPDRAGAVRRAGAAPLHLPRTARGDGAGRRGRVRGRPARPAADRRRRRAGRRARAVADGGPPVPRDRGRPGGPVRPVRRRRRVHRAGAGPGRHRIFEWPELLAVTDLASARRAIETIVEQGEGARGDWIKSHFGTFVGILEDLLAEQAADPAFNPARPVEPAFVRLPPDVEAGTLIEDPATAQVADLANGLYEVTLQVLSRYYIHHGETAAEFDTLARTAKHLMNWVMRELGPVLTALPVGPVPPGPHRRPDLRHRPPRHLHAAAPATPPGRSSKNGSMRWSRPALPSASKLASARSPRLPTSCSR